MDKYIIFIEKYLNRYLVDFSMLRFNVCFLIDVDISI